jgi:hypothetical protein
MLGRRPSAAPKEKLTVQICELCIQQAPWGYIIGTKYYSTPRRRAIALTINFSWRSLAYRSTPSVLRLKQQTGTSPPHYQAMGGDLLAHPQMDPMALGGLPALSLVGPSKARWRKGCACMQDKSRDCVWQSMSVPGAECASGAVDGIDGSAGVGAGGSHNG